MLCNLAVLIMASQVSVTTFTLDDLLWGGENSFKKSKQITLRLKAHLINCVR